MRNRFAFSLGLGLVAIVLSTTQILTAAAPKNVILFIGDGMGYEQIKAAECYKGAPLFDTMGQPVPMTTRSANSSVTDSAAAGTAMATGFKVNNGVVSVLNGQDLQTSLEFHKAAGKKTGLITTTYITHATPAAFGAHAGNRSYYTEIASDILNHSKPNLIFGGADNQNGLTVLNAQIADYTVVTDKTSFMQLATTGVEFLSAQFGSGYMPYEEDYLSGEYPYPHLSDMVTKALENLEGHEAGFFLMVEGGMIDQAGHDNNLPNSVHETLELDRAVDVALHWAATRTDTLIIVTGDHETGGLKVTQNNDIGQYPAVTWSTRDHTGVNVPLFATGPGADQITGTLDNTDVYKLCTGKPLVSPPPTTIIASGSVWKYHALGQDLGTEWRDIGYNDSAWSSGAAELGYGDTDETTNIGDGNKYSCYYFRHTFNSDNTATYSDITLELKRDDGAVVYLNGVEVHRINMPAGVISFGTLASSAADYEWDAPVVINAQFQPGVNILAVEVHQGNLTSSDVSMDLVLEAVVTPSSGNQPPMIEGDLAFTTPEDTSVAVRLEGTDPDGDQLSYTFTAPSNGTLDGQAPDLTYTPNPNFDETDSFQYTVRDGKGGTDTATVNITVTPVNDAPTAANDGFFVDQDQPLSKNVLWNDTDPDGDSLTVSLVTGPESGALTLNANGSFTFTPASGFIGTVSFTYEASDTTASSQATVSIVVRALNRNPTADDNQVVTTHEDTAVTIELGVSDPDIDDILTSTVTSGPSHGTLSVVAGELKYAPSADYIGIDTFNYTVSDGREGTDSGTVNILITAVNDDPTAPANLTATAGNAKVTLTWTASTDVDGDALSYEIVRNDVALEPVLNETSFVDSGLVNGLLYTYVVRAIDGNGGVAASGVTATPIAPDYRAYVISDPAVTAGTLAGSYTALRPDSDGSQTVTELKSGLTASLDVTYSLKLATTEAYNRVTLRIAGTYSSLEANDGLQVFVWDGDWKPVPTESVAYGSYVLPSLGAIDANGVIKVRFTDTSAVRKEKIDTLTLTDLYADLRTEQNQSPVTVSDSYNAMKDTPLTVAAAQGVLANDRDPEGGMLTASLVSGPSEGALTLSSDGSFTYEPSVGFTGTDDFTYSASDGLGGVTTGTVTISVAEAPISNPMFATTTVVKVPAGKNWKATATVTMTSGEGPVAGVSVWGTWKLNDAVVLEAAPLVADANGNVVFTSPTYKSSVTGTLKFELGGATLAGYEYQPGASSGEVTNP